MFKKISRLLILTVLAMSLVIGLVHYRSSKTIYEKESYVKLNQIQHYVEEEVDRGLGEGGKERIGNLLANFDSALQIKRGDEILFDSSGYLGMEEFPSKNGLYYSKAIQQDMLYMHQQSQGVDYHFFSFMGDRANFLRESFFHMIYAFLLGGFFALILGFLGAKKLTTPLKDMVTLTKKISQGDYSEKLRPKGKDEVSLLAQQFNEMSDGLKNTVEHLEDERFQKQAILSSITQGVIALDHKHRILFANQHVGDYLDADPQDLLGKPVLHLFRNHQIEEYLKKGETVLLPRDKRTIELSFYPMEEGTLLGHVLLLRDVTQVLHLQKMRKDFVANVSHELKTPLTSISGFSETLLHVDMEETRQKRYLELIHKEAMSLSQLIEDLLFLSEIEKEEVSTKEEETFDPFLLLEGLKPLLEAQVQEPKKLHWEVDKSPCRLRGKASFFMQLPRNLISNADKYSEEGDITLSAFAENHDFVLCVADQGQGISVEEQELIFQRFYRVDKARGPEGTGLGLSIVKHVLGTMGGKIELQSELGKGSCFRIILPGI